MNGKYLFIFFIYSAFYLILFQCKITNELNLQSINELDYIDVKQLPSVLHNDNISLTILYRCSSSTQRRISLSIHIEHAFYRKNVAIFRRHWYCQATSHIQTRIVPVQLHRSIAYASDIQSNLQSWPVEYGQLNIRMFDGKEQNENQVIKQSQYNVRFLPIHQRPSIRSLRWNPFINKIKDEYCHQEPEILRIVNYPLVLAGGAYGKHVTFPSFKDYNLRWEKQNQLKRAKFSILFWIYIDEYCMRESPNPLCPILQHVTYNDTHLTPELFLNQKGQLVVHMFGYLNDLTGDPALTVLPIPKKDWCRVLFVVNENLWNVSINCLKTWEKTMNATYISPIYNYYYNDEVGPFIIGGSDKSLSFKGFIGQMDVYRRIVLNPNQLSQKLHVSIPAFLPKIISESSECIGYLSSFNQCLEQADLFNKYIQQKNTCNASPFRLSKSNQQCLLIRTWKEESTPLLTTDIRYRVFRALYRRSMNSTNDVANKLFQLITNLLEKDDLELSCKRVLSWSEQAICYNHPTAHSLLATFHQFGLCGLMPNSTRTLELLFNGALLEDRISLLALGHRHFYGLDGVPQDYEAAYVYYRHMADQARSESYNLKAGEVVMESIRLTNDKLISQLTFDKSDSFYWLKEQARRGVLSAQQRLGSLMQSGGQGLTRNVQAAVEYWRLAADQQDASSLFMYGLALLKGRGVAKNVTEGVHHIEKAAKRGNVDALITLGSEAYNIEKNYTKAAKYWQQCYDQSQNMYCAHNLGVMWTAGRYPPDFRKDDYKAWGYFSYAAKKGQFDSRIVVAYFNAMGDHPVVLKNARLSAVWSRMVADESTGVGVIVRQALTAYRDRRWQTSFIYYLQAALAGAELGYFNAGYLCYELKVNHEKTINCIEQLLNMSLMIRDNNLLNENYDLLAVAEYYQLKKEDLNKSIELYIRLFQNGDPIGLFNLAQMEEIDDIITFDVWDRIGVKFDEKIRKNRYRRIQAVYQHCRSLRIPRRDEAYIPCTLAYLRISTIIFLDEHSKIIFTTVFLIISIRLSLSVFSSM